MRGLYRALGALALAAVLPACERRGSDSTTPASRVLPSLFRKVPLGLPAVPLAADDVPSRARIDLGRKLFIDRRLSHNDTMSCAMCHVPEQGFTSNEVSTAIGLNGRSLRRNAPTLLNVAYVSQLFDDGRETSLENQVWGPMLGSDEMANPSIGYVIQRISALPDYHGLFEAAFDGQGPSVERIGRAIASYERTLLCADSRFDRWRYAKDQTALTQKEKAGFEIFSGKGHCSDCHTIGDTWALFTDNNFHNTGIGWERSMRVESATQPVHIAPGLVVNVSKAMLDSISAPQKGDLGRYEVTLDPADRWGYRTPTLRNIALTAPYMHDGSLSTLADVVEFYDRGGIDNPLKDPLLKPLGLTPEEKEDLVAFLKALTGDNTEQLARDARSQASFAVAP
jgi:cytochrome c peroxidase